MITIYERPGFTVSLANNEDWGIAWPWLERAMPYMQGRMTQAQIYDRVRDGVSQLWIVTSGGDDIGALLTSISGDGFFIELIGGDGMDLHIKEGLPAVERYMQSRYGSNWVQLVGRVGWGKRLRTMGYKPQVLMCEKRMLSTQ